MITLKVSSKSNPASVAGVIANLIRENDKLEMQVIGAGAVNQAMKGLAIARGYVASLGIDLVCIPSFTEITVENEVKTGLKLVIKGEK